MITPLFAFYRPGRGALAPKPSEGSACAVCGIHVTGTEPDWAAEASALGAVSLWRRCDDCARLGDELGTIREPRGQALAVSAHILGHTISPVDRDAVWALAQNGVLRTWSQTGAGEADAGAETRWSFLGDLATHITLKASQLDLEARGIPVPAPYRACVYCGTNRSRSGWGLVTLNKGRRGQRCNDCRDAINDTRSAADQLVDVLDQLAADRAGLAQVPSMPSALESYADSVGFRLFDPATDQPAPTRFGYLQLTGATR